MNRLYKIRNSGELAHSKGAWKKHKYIRKEGSGSSAKYYYAVKSGSNEGSGKDPSTMGNIELAAYVKETTARENEAYDKVSSSYDAMIAAGYQPGKQDAIGEPVYTNGGLYKISYGKDTKAAVDAYNQSCSEFKAAKSEAVAARKEATNRAKNKGRH